MRRRPVAFFVIAPVSAVAALNEGNPNHWGTTIALPLVALASLAAGIWTLREERVLRATGPFPATLGV